jgi:serine/threonine protein kinase
VILAFEYLHSQNIIYRDLKPENLLIGQDGHIKLTDFGFAKIVPDVTRTLCGTPEYLAPEIIRSKEYGKAVDWYALGILIFEMLSGYPPYYNDNHVRLYESVLEGNMTFPAHFDKQAIDLIRRLTVRDVSMRYGNLRHGVQDIKQHPWFHGVNWQRLYEKKIKPPYLPKIAEPGDARHFELYPEERTPYDALPDIQDSYASLFIGI